MPRISIIGVRTDHLVNAPPASPVCISFDLGGPTARSRPSPSWVDCITSIGVLHDGYFFAPFSLMSVTFNPLCQTYWSIYGGLEAQMNR
jgi:hypothetical protein